MPSQDNQLGSELRLRKPPGSPSRQVLESMVRDLVGADESLLPALQHLIARPLFLALDPTTASTVQRLLARDELLNQLAETYHPKVADRLRAFLDGYLDLSSSSPGTEENRAKEVKEITEPVWSSPNPPSSPRASATQAPPPNPWTDQPSSVGAGPPNATPPTSPAKQRSPFPLLVGVGLIAGLGIGIASRVPTLCRPLGLCSSAQSSGQTAQSASSKALDRAQKAADAMASASSLPAFESALTDLDRELLRLSGDPLTPEQVGQRQLLEGKSKDGHQRLSKEQQEAETVKQASGRVEALPSLPAERQNTEKQSITESLMAIPARSFSYGEAQGLLKRLSSIPSATPVTPETPEVAPTPQPTPQPSPEPTPAPAPRWQPPSRSSGGGQSTWTAPRRSSPTAAPAPSQPPEQDGSNAPYRDDPLF
jgi:hypothetical protein